MSKIKKFVFASDNHGELACEETLAALWEYCRDFKPDIRIGGGDHFDFGAIRKGAMGEMEGVRSMKDDLEAGRHFLAKFRPTHVCWGNHDNRLLKMAREHQSSVVRDYCSDNYQKINMWARQAGAKVIHDYHRDKPLQIGPITAYHGNSNNLMSMGRFYNRKGGIFLCGHGHHGHQVNLELFDRGAAYMAPALANLDLMDYSSNTQSAAKHNNGWVAGWFNDEGQVKAWIIHKVGGGKWYWPTDIRVYDYKKR